jgi:phosphoribosylanthranilate isomerase
MIVKICGNTTKESLDAAIEAGADMVGFILCTGPRLLDAETVRTLVRYVNGRAITVGVFCSDSPSYVNEILEYCNLDFAQLSGNEDLDFVKQVKRPSLKVIRLRSGMDKTWQMWPEDVILIFDTPKSNVLGGSGQPWEWEWAVEAAEKRKIMISGGLDPDNVGEVVRSVRPWGVDVSSGVEFSPGKKDPELVYRFVRAAKGGVKIS